MTGPPARARAVEQLPGYDGGGTGIHRADEFVPAELLASVEGPAARRDPYHLAQSLWTYEQLAAAPHSWICAIGDGPHMLASLSSESIWFRALLHRCWHRRRFTARRTAFSSASPA